MNKPFSDGPNNLTIDSSLGKPKKIPNHSLKGQWSDVPVVYAKPKQKLLLQCSTSKYYGNLALSWYVLEDVVHSKNIWKLMEHTNSKVLFFC